MNQEDFKVDYDLFSAAHCLKPKGEKEAKRTTNIKVRVGAFNLLNFIEKESLFLTPSRISIHEDWNSFDQNFCHFNNAHFIKPICLFQANDLVRNINDGWIIGYGITSDYHNILPRKLRIVDSRTCCVQEPRFTQLVSPRTFCASSKICSNICQSFWAVVYLFSTTYDSIWQKLRVLHLVMDTESAITATMQFLRMFI